MITSLFHSKHKMMEKFLKIIQKKIATGPNVTIGVYAIRSINLINSLMVTVCFMNTSRLMAIGGVMFICGLNTRDIHSPFLGIFATPVGVA